MSGPDELDEINGISTFGAASRISYPEPIEADTCIHTEDGWRMGAMVVNRNSGIIGEKIEKITSDFSNLTSKLIPCCPPLQVFFFFPRALDAEEAAHLS